MITGCNCFPCNAASRWRDKTDRHEERASSGSSRRKDKIPGIFSARPRFTALLPNPSLWRWRSPRPTIPQLGFHGHQHRGIGDPVGKLAKVLRAGATITMSSNPFGPMVRPVILSMGGFPVNEVRFPAGSWLCRTGYPKSHRRRHNGNNICIQLNQPTKPLRTASMVQNEPAKQTNCNR